MTRPRFTLRVSFAAIALAIAAACGTQRGSIDADSTWSHDVAKTRPDMRAAPSASSARSAGQPAPSGSSGPPLSKNAFKLPMSSDSNAALWGDGGALLFAGTDNGPRRIERGGAVIDAEARDLNGGIAGTGSGATVRAAVVGDTGRIAVFHDGAWDTFLAPALEFEQLAAPAFDSSGKLYAAGAFKALYVQDGDAWTIHRYPSGPTNIVSITFAQDGTLYLVGGGGRILAYANGAFRDVAVTGLTAGALGSKWVSAKIGPTTGTLWVLTEDALLNAIDVAHGNAKTIKVPLFGHTEAMDVAKTPSGDVLVIAGMGDLGIYDGNGFYAVDGDCGFAKSVWVDVKDATVYAGAMSNICALPLVHPAFGTGQGRPLTPP
jgi:hypothetical protein